jgi:hypothetical protein
VVIILKKELIFPWVIRGKMSRKVYGNGRT